MPSRTVRVVNDSGLHARAGRVFVKSARDQKCAVTVRKGERVVDGRSTISVMTIDCGPDDQIEISADGEDAEHALAALVMLVESGLGEL
ncbi:MAG TPA: HPr family phosphocarrier protein [Euzebyales bacterium]|nr:HPr family phosphocarrier protein [Euzebyales bacterium]